MPLTHESSRAKTALLDTDYTKDLSTAALRHHGGFYVTRISKTCTSRAARAFSHEVPRSIKAHTTPNEFETGCFFLWFFLFKVRSCLIRSNPNGASKKEKENDYCDSGSIIF